MAAVERNHGRGNENDPRQSILFLDRPRQDNIASTMQELSGFEFSKGKRGSAGIMNITDNQWEELTNADAEDQQTAESDVTPVPVSTGGSNNAAREDTSAQNTSMVDSPSSES